MNETIKIPVQAKQELTAQELADQLKQKLTGFFGDKASGTICSISIYERTIRILADMIASGEIAAFHSVSVITEERCYQVAVCYEAISSIDAIELHLELEMGDRFAFIL